MLETDSEVSKESYQEQIEGWKKISIIWGISIIENESESAPAIYQQPKKDGTKQSEPELHTLFEPMKQIAITLLFDRVTKSEWKNYFSRASRNGLKNIRDHKGLYNPLKVADWLVQKGRYTREHVDRKLANNLPERSKDKKYRLTGELE